MVGHNVLEFVRVPDAKPNTTGMLAAELMYFHGAPLAHVVAYEDRLRVKRQQITFLRDYRAKTAEEINRA